MDTEELAAAAANIWNMAEVNQSVVLQFVPPAADACFVTEWRVTTCVEIYLYQKCLLKENEGVWRGV